MKIQDQTLHDQLVTLDGHEYVRCVLMNCYVLVTATSCFSLRACEFKSCRFSFGGAAGLTLNALAILYHGGFKALLEDTFRNVAAGAVPPVELQRAVPLREPQPASFVGQSCNWSYILDGQSALGHPTFAGRAQLKV